MGDALAELARQGVDWRANLGPGTRVVPAPPPPPETREPEDWPQSGREKKPEKSADPLFRFRGGAKHIDMRQARGDLSLIKTWIDEWDAQWHRNRDGSYQAMLSYGEDDEPGEGPEWALDKLQTAAETLPGPAVIRFGLWYRGLKEEGGSPRPGGTFGEVKLTMVRTALVREFNAATSLADGWRKGGPELDRGRLEVMWPSIKKATEES